MQDLPTDVSVGDELTKEEIEDVFDTRFGYQISGINPRRNSNDRRYVIVFAKEDGPYDDSIKQGQFEYIGEGLSGDQKETSPGNSALINTISSDIPIHFFYKPHRSNGWEYQGQVDVLHYNFEERDGRQVLVFSMEHKQSAVSKDDPDEKIRRKQKLRMNGCGLR